jgi:hypothetical protein
MKNSGKFTIPLLTANFVLSAPVLTKFYKIKNFMTRGLLTSRNIIKILHRTSLAFPTAENVQRYKNFKTLYQRVLRAAKKRNFTSKLEENAKNPKPNLG